MAMSCKLLYNTGVLHSAWPNAPPPLKNKEDTHPWAKAAKVSVFWQMAANKVMCVDGTAYDAKESTDACTF